MRDLYKFLCMLSLLWIGHYNMLRTSGFVDDIIFFHNVLHNSMNFAMKDQFRLNLL